ncbi:MAG: DMT family transporter [Clostridia bacterium]|nr:DMT family transporter [Clostridia bacterium]
MSTERKATLSVILAGVLWGFITVFIKNLSKGGLDSFQIALVRMIVASISFSIFMAVKNPALTKIAVKDCPLFIGTGIISVVLFNCFYFYTMINSEASIAVILLYTSPIFVCLMSALFFKEKMTKVSFVALIFTTIGCALVAGLNLKTGISVKPFIIFTGLCSGLFYALYTIFGRLALKKYNTMTVTMYTFVFGLIGSIPIGKPVELVRTVKATPVLLLWCLGIGFFCTVLPYFFYTWGLERIPSGKAAILVAVEPLVGAFLGMFFFNESRNLTKIIGIILILTAVILLNLPSQSDSSKK